MRGDGIKRIFMNLFIYIFYSFIARSNGHSVTHKTQLLYNQHLKLTYTIY